MKILKNKEVMDEAYITALHDYILENQKIFFAKENEATSWYDFNTFPQQLETCRDTLCMPNEPMLIDRDHDGVHTYCICTISEKGKITSEVPVIEVSKLDRNCWRNGYFLLPEITQKTNERQQSDDMVTPQDDEVSELQQDAGEGYAI